MAILLASPARADEPDGPDDRTPVEVAPQPPPPPPPLPPEQPPPPPAPPPLALVPPSEEVLRLERSGKAMVGGGAFLLAMGAALELSGLIMSAYTQLATPPTCFVGKPCPEEDVRTNILISGIVSSLAAGGMIYGGLAVLSAGKGRIRRAKLMKLHMSFGAQQVSASMALTF